MPRRWTVIEAPAPTKGISLRARSLAINVAGAVNLEAAVGGAGVLLDMSGFRYTRPRA